MKGACNGNENRYHLHPLGSKALIVLSPDIEDTAARRMCGAALLVHLRWAAALDRLAHRASSRRRVPATVVLLPEVVLRRAIARLAPR